MSTELCIDVFEGRYTHVHYFRMDVPGILRGIALAAGVKQTGLGDLIGVSQPQISRYMTGAKPKQPAYEKIMDAARKYGVIDDTNVSSEDVAASLGRPMPNRVRVKGYVGAGGHAHFYAVDPGDLGSIEGGERDTDQTVALVIIGSSLGRFFDRWHVLYDDVRSPITDDLIGELCVVGLADDRVLVKKIRRNGRRYDLLSNAESEEPIENVVIEWAAKVTDLRRG